MRPRNAAKSSAGGTWVNRTISILRCLLWPSVPLSAILGPAVASDSDVVERVFDWERERMAMMAKGIAGTASAVALAALAAAFDGKHFTGQTTTFVIAAVALMFLWSAVLMIGLQGLGSQYAISVMAAQSE